MKLLKIKLRVPGSAHQTDWLDLSPRLTLFACPDTTCCIQFSEIAETINPPFSCRENRPFARLPSEIDKNGYKERIFPAKYSVSLGVFAATPQLVKELGVINELLYETDRIEVGRRLDNSRWLNFVELSSSTRWGEISEDFKTLSKALPPSSSTSVEQLHQYIHALGQGDRIKNTLMNQLADWLVGLDSPSGDTEIHLQIRSLLKAVLRADDFRKARDLVWKRLPMVVSIGSSERMNILLNYATRKAKEYSDTEKIFIERLNDELASGRAKQEGYSFQTSAEGIILAGKSATAASCNALDEFKAGAAVASALSRVLYEAEPVLLFSKPEKKLLKGDYSKFQDFLIQAAENIQCICCTSSKHTFEDRGFPIQSLIGA